MDPAGRTDGVRAVPGGGREPTSRARRVGHNFRVGDLDAIVAQLRATGIDVEIDPEEYPNGRFAQLRDPEGNAIQLWEPS